MENKTKILTAIVIGLALLTGCGDKTKETLSNYRGTYQEPVEPQAGYQRYAIRLQKKYPNKLGRLDSRDIYAFLREINNEKMLRADGTIKLPIY